MITHFLKRTSFNSLLFFAFLISTFQSYGQLFGQRVRGVEVLEQGVSYYTDISGVETKSTQINEFEVAVKLVDPASLDDYFYEVDRINGKLQYTVYDTSREKFFHKKKRKKRTKSDSEFLLEGLRWLLQNDKIDEELYQKIYRDIIETYEEDDSGLETMEFKHEFYNPYFIGDKYLSLFKVEITNTSSVPKPFNSNIVLNTNNTSLEPLSDEEILQYIEDYVNIDLYMSFPYKVEDVTNAIISVIQENKYSKSLILNRYNFQSGFLVPANSTVSKYVAVVPIDNTNGQFDMNFVDEDTSKKLHWEVEKQRSILNETYYYYELVLNAETSGNSYKEYEFIEYVNGQADAYLDEDLLYVNRTDTNKEIEVFCYAMTSSNKLNYGCFKFKASDYFDLKKNRRQEIEYELTEIEGIQKKVKNK